MDPSKFDETEADTIFDWLLAVEQYGVAQLAEDHTTIVSCAMSNLCGLASESVCLTPMADEKAFPECAISMQNLCHVLGT